jgi:putative ABC transport system ATP-binding protein
MSIVDLSEISRLYGLGDATTVALDDVSLNIQSGEFVAIMGPSGSGKSTLLHIMGLLDRPSHGSYKFANREVASINQNKKAKLRRDNIGFVFQSFNLLPRLSALENTALPLAYKGMTQVRRLKKASAMLERIGLAEREYFMPNQLSGGQSQRVAIARALVNEPDLIIADEPTGNLDSASSKVIMELLSELHETGKTIVMVTHNPELTRYASRVVFMQDGAIVADIKSKVGEVPALAKKRMYSITVKNEDDDLSGVSALMRIIPDKREVTSKSSNKKQSQKSKKTSRTKSKNYKSKKQTSKVKK